ncbi:hypothetical protein O181_025856 [Austropuccinia psidii MF-1]|uniref:Uncharacterized protein n=1 Tax=Austropuccinia psidii MF-1 TaxID=1389203 RepID=A0A9Q3CPA5_9BASI|nr:hypothetical protein [Austropuccinia psidii MF-1]
MKLERRHRKDSLTRPFNQTHKEGGFRTLAQYKKLIGECDIISKHQLQYGYFKRDDDYPEYVFDSLSPKTRMSITKRSIKDSVIIQARDGGHILPEMETIRQYN